jgi:hypothetical protein
LPALKKGYSAIALLILRLIKLGFETTQFGKQFLQQQLLTFPNGLLSLVAADGEIMSYNIIQAELIQLYQGAICPLLLRKKIFQGGNTLLPG